MFEKDSKCIAACISTGTELVENREVLIDMPIRGLSVSLPASLRLFLRMLGELLNEFFERHHQTPFLMSTFTDWVVAGGRYSVGALWPVSRCTLRGVAHAWSRARSRTAAVRRGTMRLPPDRGGFSLRDRHGPGAHPEHLAREEVPGGGRSHLVWLSYQFGPRANDPGAAPRAPPGWRPWTCLAHDAPPLFLPGDPCASRAFTSCGPPQR
jgi:hypothetical protein